MSDAVGNSKRVRINQFTFNHRGKPPGINVFTAAQYDPNLLNNIENPYSPVVNTISRELPGYLTSDDILEITLSWRAAMQVPFYFTIQTNKLYMRRLMRMQLARLICQGLLQFLKSHGPGEAAAKNMRLLRIHRPAPMEEEEEENDRDRWEIEVIMEDGHRFESHHLQFLNLSPIHHRLQWQYEPRLGRNVAEYTEHIEQVTFSRNGFSGVSVEELVSQRATKPLCSDELKAVVDSGDIKLRSIIPTVIDEKDVIHLAYRLPPSQDVMTWDFGRVQYNCHHLAEFAILACKTFERLMTDNMKNCHRCQNRIECPSHPSMGSLYLHEAVRIDTTDTEGHPYWYIHISTIRPEPMLSPMRAAAKPTQPRDFLSDLTTIERSFGHH